MDEFYLYYLERNFRAHEVIENILKEQWQSTLVYNKVGRPELVGEKKLYISITKTRDLCVFAICSEKIGIDIERDDGIIRTKIADKYFHEQELAKLKEKTTSSMFYEIWTKKESYLKMNNLSINSFPIFTVLGLEDCDFFVELINGNILTICLPKGKLYTKVEIFK